MNKTGGKQLSIFAVSCFRQLLVWLLLFAAELRGARKKVWPICATHFKHSKNSK
jgi:hypothetical protein